MIKYLLSLPWVAITGHEIIEVSTCNIKRPPALKHWEIINWFSLSYDLSGCAMFSWVVL